MTTPTALVSPLPPVATGLSRRVWVGSADVMALRGLSLTVQRGETVVVSVRRRFRGAALLACLAGLEEPDRGVVLVNGERLTGRSPRARARYRNLYPGGTGPRWNLLGHLTVAENAAVVHAAAHERRSWRTPASRAAARDRLDELGVGHRAHAYPATPSPAETIRAALAVALGARPVAR